MDSAFTLSDVSNIIDRCFNANRVTDILNNLKNEKHPFADYCIKRIQEKSPIAQEVTLRLLRNAVNLDFHDVLLEEINAMKNLILHSKDFEIVMTNKILPQEKREKFCKFSKKLSEITKKDVDFYFANQKENLKNIHLEIKKNSLLPNRVHLTI